VPLINLVIVLIVVGVLLWLVNTYIPMDGKIKNILNIVVVIAVILWLLQAFGLLGSLNSIRVGMSVPETQFDSPVRNELAAVWRADSTVDIIVG
jgi:hypothetical protein